MQTNEFPYKVGDWVTRIDNDRPGYQGTVIEIDQVNNRCRISWERNGQGNPVTMPRTWLRLQAIAKR